MRFLTRNTLDSLRRAQIPYPGRDLHECGWVVYGVEFAGGDVGVGGANLGDGEGVIWGKGGFISGGRLGNW